MSDQRTRPDEMDEYEAAEAKAARLRAAGDLVGLRAMQTEYAAHAAELREFARRRRLRVLDGGKAGPEASA